MSEPEVVLKIMAIVDDAALISKWEILKRLKEILSDRSKEKL